MWLVIGVIPAATARETPHALRIETVIPTLQILVAYGLVQAFVYIRKFKIPFIVPVSVTVLGLVLLANVMYYLHGYYTHYPREYSSEWQYGYEQAIQYVASVQNNYEAIYTSELHGRPYVYFLLHMNVDPRVFRQTAQIERDPFGFVHVKKFGKYHFEASDTELRTKGNILFLSRPEEVPDNVRIVKEFNLLNGAPSIVAYTLK